jgi:excisionase family DNA binding protein
MSSDAPDRDLLLTVKEYADIKRVTAETVRRWIRSGKLHAERTIANGDWRIRVPRAA